MNALIEQIAPPFAMKFARKLKAVVAPTKNSLFDGDDQAFKALASEAKVYGEYGCGASTRWVAGETEATILAVDTAKVWIDSVRADVDSRKSVSLKWVDLGPLADWGRPIGYTRSDRFHEYTEWLWQQTQKPDLVLVDGRFRVCCFATSLKHAAADTTIIFDDYTNRPQYHIVEALLPFSSTCGRQAIFKVPSRANLDLAKVDEMITNFRFVID